MSRQLVLLVSTAIATAGSNIAVDVAEDGSMTLLVGSEPWLQTAPYWLAAHSQVFSTSDGSLSLKSNKATSGHDAAGAYTGTILAWDAGQTPFITTVKVYRSHAVFAQFFPAGVANSGIGTEDGSRDRDTLLSAFPTFVAANGSDERGVVSYQGEMTGGTYGTSWPPPTNNETHGYNSTKVGTWGGSSEKDHDNVIGEGIGGTGPIVLFSKQTSGPSLVISAASNFMAASQTSALNTLSFGVMGAVSQIPANYSIEFVVSVGTGVNSAMESWGDILLARYGKERYAYKRDLAIRTLGYSTDNGAYYYYNPEPNKTMEATLYDVKAYSEEQNIPYHYVLLDSWWYFKGAAGGVTSWDARPDIFPSGLATFSNQTGWGLMLHNRMWDPQTNYSATNGGAYHFIDDNSTVLVPDDQQFWNELIANKSKAGMFMYEQDWLDTEFDRSKTLGQSATMGRNWMMQMNNGCQNSNVTIQLCMTHVRHIMQSVEMPAVTNARASGDYHPSGQPQPDGTRTTPPANPPQADQGNLCYWCRQWDIGTSSIFAHAVGIGPSKDNYWSTPVQKGNIWGDNTTEPRGRLQAAVLSFSNGPVAVADKIGASNVSIIMKACDAGGTLLSPDRPAMLIDSSFAYKAFGAAGSPNSCQGELWFTHVVIGNARYGYVFAPDLKKDYVITTKEMGYPETTATGEKLALVATRNHAVSLDGGAIPSTTLELDTAVGIPITKTEQSGWDPTSCTNTIRFEVVLVSPMLAGGWYFLGEPDKWVSVSSQRFSDVATSGSSASVKLTGAPGEKVTVSWRDPTGKGVTKACTIPLTMPNRDHNVNIKLGGTRITMTMHLVLATTVEDGYDTMCKES